MFKRTLALLLLLVAGPAMAQRVVTPVGSVVVSVDSYGAVHNGTTDDSAAINACLTAVAAVYGECQMSNAKYFAASSITIPARATLRGGADPGGDVPTWNPGNLRPVLLLATGTTVNVAGQIENLAIWRTGVTINPATAPAATANLANYAGTGLTLTGPAVASNIVLIGHAQAVDTNSQANWRLKHLRGDNLAGLKINGMHDWSFAEDIEWMPMNGPASGIQFDVSVVTAISSGPSNGAGGNYIHVTTGTTSNGAVNDYVAGMKIVLYNLPSNTGANGRWVIGNVTTTGFDLITNAVTSAVSVFTNAYSGSDSALVSGMCNTGVTCAVLNTTARPGPAYQVLSSESPMLVNALAYGYDTTWDISTAAGWTTVYGLSLDNLNIPDPGTTGIKIQNTAYGTKLHIGYVSSTWTSVIVNTPTGLGNSDPHLIFGGSLYTTAPSGSTQASVTLTAGAVSFVGTSMINNIISVAAAAKVRFNGVTAAGSTWLSGSDFTNTSIGSTFGDVSGVSTRGAQVHLQVPSGTAWLDALAVGSTGAITASYPTSVNIGDNQATYSTLHLTGSDSTGNGGGQLWLTNGHAGAVNPNKYMRITSGAGNFEMLNSAYSGVLFGITESGTVTMSGVSGMTTPQFTKHVRVSTSPANNDIISDDQTLSQNSSSAQISFTDFQAISSNVTAGSETGKFIWQTRTNGAAIANAGSLGGGVFALFGQHLQFNGTAPTLGSGAADCGTSPSAVSGNDNVGRFTVGTSTNGGKCTLTFANSPSTWSNAPICRATDETQGTALGIKSPSTTSVVIFGTLTASDVVSYSCVGWQ